MTEATLTPVELIQAAGEHGRDRYRDKIQAGVSTVRRDGSVATEEHNRQGAAAERFAADFYGRPFNDKRYGGRGDGGHDFTIELTVEVVWLGIDPKTGLPKTREWTGGRHPVSLLVNPWETWRHADIYVLTAGAIETGFQMVGWATHYEVSRGPVADLGYGEKWAFPVSRLRSPAALNDVLRRPKQ
jgi:hypothetical protein